MDMNTPLTSRSLRIFALATSVGALALTGYLPGITKKAHAAKYLPDRYMISGGISYDVTQAKGLNERIQSVIDAPTKIEGLIGFRLIGERGLVEPDWTHWIDLSYQLITVAGKGGDGADFEHSLNTFTIVPLGASYWFTRTAYVDIGVGFGLGLGFGSSYDLTYTPAGSSNPVSESYAGGVAPVVDTKLQMRMWLGNGFGLTGSAAFRYYSPVFASEGGTELDSGIYSLSGFVGATWAIGGTKGTGHSFTEVIKGRPAKSLQRKKRKRGKKKRRRRGQPSTR